MDVGQLRYYEDASVPFLMDEVYTFSEEELPEEVRKELPTSGPLESKLSNGDAISVHPRLSRSGRRSVRLSQETAVSGNGKAGAGAVISRSISNTLDQATPKEPSRPG